jgi:hypothetical protein
MYDANPLNSTWNTVVGQVSGGLTFPTDMVINREGTVIYFIDLTDSTGTFNAIDTASNTITISTPIQLAYTTNSMAINPNGNSLSVTSNLGGTYVSLVSLPSCAITQVSTSSSYKYAHGISYGNFSYITPTPTPSVTVPGTYTTSNLTSISNAVNSQATTLLNQSGLP